MKSLFNYKFGVLKTLFLLLFFSTLLISISEAAKKKDGEPGPQRSSSPGTRLPGLKRDPDTINKPGTANLFRQTDYQKLKKLARKLFKVVLVLLK